MSNTRMPDLDRHIHFGGAEDVHPDDLGRAAVRNLTTAIDTVLHNNFRWSGAAIGVVGLTLNQDNTRVANGAFITRGDTDLAEYRQTCDQIWPEGPANVTLAIRVSSLNPFTFSSGGLHSDLIPSERFTHSFYDASQGATNTPILGTPSGRGIGEFCLRLVFQPSSTSSGRKGVIIKYTVVLYPASADHLSNSPESAFAGWPGFRIADGHFPLGPTPTTKWQCPIVPLLRPGIPFEEEDNAPSGARLRFAVAAVMRKCCQADISRTVAGLFSKWDRIRISPRDIQDKPPANTWPEHAPVPETEGEYTQIMCQIKYPA